MEEQKKEETTIRFLEPGWKIEADGTGVPYFRQGEVAFPISKDSLTRTVEAVGQLNLPTLRALAEFNKLPTEPFVSKEMLEPVIAGLVQFCWYREVRGQVPQSVLLNQDRRTERYLKLIEQGRVDPTSLGKLKEKAPRKAKAPRGPLLHDRRWKLTPLGTKELKAKKFGGQAALVMAALGKLGEATLEEVTAAVVATGKLETKQPPERVVHYYLNEYRKRAYVLVVGEQAELPTAQEPAPEPAAQEPAVVNGADEAKPEEKSAPPAKGKVHKPKLVGRKGK